MALINFLTRTFILVLLIYMKNILYICVLKNTRSRKKSINLVFSKCMINIANLLV